MEYQFQGGNRKLQCRNCRYSRNLGQNSNQVDNRGLGDGVKLNEFPRGLELETKGKQCKSCKSLLAFDLSQSLKQCPFCLGTDFEDSDQNGKVITPYGIIPFTIPMERAQKILKTWLTQGPPYLPDDIMDVTKPEFLKGVFIPMFLFDALTRSTWKGDEYYQSREKRGDKVEVRQIAEPTAGYFEHFFESLYIPLTNGLDGQYVQELVRGYSLRDIISYDAGYLPEWMVELYQISEKDAFSIADELMDDYIFKQVVGRMKGEPNLDPESKTSLKINKEKHSIAFRHILVPVWVTTYKYHGKRFQYLINGQNGHVFGFKPLSFRKMYITVAAIVAVVIFLVLLVRW